MALLVINTYMPPRGQKNQDQILIGWTANLCGWLYIVLLNPNLQTWEKTSMLDSRQAKALHFERCPWKWPPSWVHLPIWLIMTATDCIIASPCLCQDPRGCLSLTAIISQWSQVFMQETHTEDCCPPFLMPTGRIYCQVKCIHLQIKR